MDNDYWIRLIELFLGEEEVARAALKLFPRTSIDFFGVHVTKNVAMQTS